MIQDKRLAKLTRYLTPKQAVILWLEEIQHIQNVVELIQYMKGLPEPPLTRITGQVDETVRESMKGKPKEAVNAAVRRAVRDVVFLIKLQHQVNYKVMTEERAWILTQALMAEALNNMHHEFLYRNLIVDSAERVNFEMPYPLESETAKVVEIAIRHHVHAFEDIVEEGYIRDWLWDYLMQKGEKELPEDAYSYQDNLPPVIKPEKEAEVRGCFKDETQFELFHSGKDYKNDLATVTDAEYNGHYQTMVNGLRDLVASRKVEGGQVIHLETVPIPYLQTVPLIEGKWLDRQVLELAEWGAMIHSLGYQMNDNGDNPDLATIDFEGKNGDKADPTELQKLLQKARRQFIKFPGRTKKIEGHDYIYFEDYSKWPGHKVKGNLRENIKAGIVTTSWNRWIGSQSSEEKATLAGIPAGNLHDYVDQYSYYCCQGDVEEHLEKRCKFMDSIRIFRNKPERQEALIQSWKDSIKICLSQLYAFKEAVNSISRNYFESHQILLPDYQRDLNELISDYEENVKSFNDNIANGITSCEPLKLGEIHRSANHLVNQQIVTLVDMAKSDALDCLGEEEEASKIAERYL